MMRKISILPMLQYIMLSSLSLLSLFTAGCIKSEQNPNASKIVVKIYELVSDGKNNPVGTITFFEQAPEKNTSGVQKLVIETDLNLPGVSQGEYGFHIHENPSCDPAEKDGKQELGLAAGGHFDPNNTHRHLGPNNPEGHLGDLPVLVVGKRGRAQNTLEVPRLTLSDVINHSVMIHAGGDNYSDSPTSLGGGGARRFCGVITTN